MLIATVSLRRGGSRSARVHRSRVIALFLSSLVAGCGGVHGPADVRDDAPEAVARSVAPYKDASTYDEALQMWRSPEDINAWIGARFTYDRARAMALSETQRSRTASLAIHAPRAFFTSPSGVCVDLSRFAVESLRDVDPDVVPRYVMIEFAPVEIAGNTLRLHWLASFTRDGEHYFFADSKRPGHIAGPYASTEDFIQDYARYRDRQIVAFRELDSYQRKQRALAAKQTAAR